MKTYPGLFKFPTLLCKVASLGCLYITLFICGFSQAPTQNKVLTQSDSVRLVSGKLSWSVWRTDYYICTGIAYAKSLGKTPEDFGVFVGNEHASSWDGRFNTQH